jgi:signal transduction histidine kinase/CheY-like chemotaxis protein
MPDSADSLQDTGGLHHRAESLWRERQADGARPRNKADTQRLLHELEVHQIELEMQNAELAHSRLETETALERVTDLFDFAPIGYLTLERSGTILESNLAAAALLGLARSALAKRRFALFVAPAARAAFAAFLDRVFATKVRERCELTVTPEGTPEIEVELEAVAVDSGRECRVALLDRTERKRAAEDRLVLDKLESTGILAGGIAHDFNNLLVGIILNLDMARMYAAPEGEQNHFLDEAKRTAFLARGLTQQLLAFAHGGAAVREPIDLSMLIRESVRPALSGSTVQCHFVLPDKLWPVLGDADQIGQVIRNLVMNAREALPEGGVVTVRAENVDRRSPDMPALPPGGYVRVCVADQGVGISPQDLPKIFDPYFSTKQRGATKGMGLGLTICHTIVHKHGGALTVKTVPGQGATFAFYLPSSLAPPISAAATLRELPRCGKILVMDDEDTVREVCGKILRKMGHEVQVVEDGQLAVEAFVRAKDQGLPFDVVFLDLTIRNGIGGVETVHTLRRIDPGVKAVVMSGFSDDPIVREHDRHGFVASLVKPFDTGQMQEVLVRILGSGPVHKATP